MCTTVGIQQPERVPPLQRHSTLVAQPRRRLPVSPHTRGSLSVLPYATGSSSGCSPAARPAPAPGAAPKPRPPATAWAAVSTDGALVGVDACECTSQARSTASSDPGPCTQRPAASRTVLPGEAAACTCVRRRIRGHVVGVPCGSEHVQKHVAGAWHECRCLPPVFLTRRGPARGWVHPWRCRRVYGGSQCQPPRAAPPTAPPAGE